MLKSKYGGLEIMAGLGILGFIVFIILVIKDAAEPTIPAGSWNNWDLIHDDKYNKKISQKEFEKNLRNGKYK